MKITFEPLNESHFPLLLKWLEAPHVKKWWPADRSLGVGGDQDVMYTLELVREKYRSYVQGYKLVDGQQKPIQAFIIHSNQVPIGYIQIYNAYDFPRSKPLSALPQSLGAFDVFIGVEEALGQGVGASAISEFLKLHGGQYSHIFADPDSNNVAAIKCYERAGFKKLSEREDTEEVWMIINNLEFCYLEENEHKILDDLKSREPIFHHPEKFGKTKQDLENQRSFMKSLTYRKARIADLPAVVKLLLEDDLGAMRESRSAELDTNYIKAFHKIDSDPNQYLMVVENGDEIIGTCHLTIMPSLTFIGSTRMQIEAVRVAGKYRGQKIGSWMFDQAIRYGKEHDVSIIQLTTNKNRPQAKHFYEKLGFEASHEGMKLYLRKTL